MIHDPVITVAVAAVIAYAIAWVSMFVADRAGLVYPMPRPMAKPEPEFDPLITYTRRARPR